MSDNSEAKKQLAKLKRLATDVASEIHDIVEDRFLTDYKDLAPLSEKAIQAMEEYHKYKNENSL